MFEIFKIKKFKKKGALQLSINAIVIVVLAMSLLGLGLTFIRSIFKGLEEQRSEITEQVKQQILEDLRTGNKKLSFPSTDVDLVTKTALQIRHNALESARMTCNRLLETNLGKSGYRLKIRTYPFHILRENPLAAGAADAEVYPIKITDENNIVEVYKVRMHVYKGDGSPYAEKTFFLNVR